MPPLDPPPAPLAPGGNASPSAPVAPLPAGQSASPTAPPAPLAAGQAASPSAPPAPLPKGGGVSGPDTLTISGTGIAAMNGDYPEIAQVNSRDAFENSSGRVVWTGTKWVIQDGEIGGPYLTIVESTENVTTPNLVVQWFDPLPPNDPVANVIVTINGGGPAAPPAPFPAGQQSVPVAPPSPLSPASSVPVASPVTPLSPGRSLTPSAPPAPLAPGRVETPPSPPQPA